MIETQPRPTIRTLVASFLFTDLVGFSKGSASDQYAAKAKLSGVLRRHLAALKESDYWIKDTGDGALIAFISNPEHALYMALALSEDYGDGADGPGGLRTGLHLGTVKESIDVEARRNFIGDGINAAKRIMDFAQPGQITASRAFFEAIANLDAAYAALFKHVGAPDDKHGRAHELYTLAPSASVLERLRGDLAADAGVAESASAQGEAASVAAAATTRGAAIRRPVIIAGVLVAIAAIAVTMRVREPSAPAPPPAAGTPQSQPSPTVTKQAPDAAAPVAETPKLSPVPENPKTSPGPPAVAASPPATSTHVAPSERAIDTSRSASGPAATPRAAPEPRPRAAAPAQAAEANAGPSGPRCTRIVEKAALGEPLTPEEKRELANSCR